MPSSPRTASDAAALARRRLQFEKMPQPPVPKLILGLAAPTILSMLITSIYNLADTFFVGQLSTSASGAVGVVSSLMAIIQALGFMLGHGAGGIISRSLGSQDTHAATKLASTSFFTALPFGAVLAVLGLAALPDFMMLLGSTDTILPHACAYARPILIAAPLMMSSLVMNVVNIGGNAILIFGFKMGVMGAALASLVSRAVACCAVLFLLQKPDCMLRITGLSALRPDGGLIQRILRVGIPAGIENGMFQIGKLSVASLTSTLGTAAIAANAVANTTSTFLNIPASAVGMAVLTVVGQCLGAGEKEQAVWYARRLLLVAYCGAWVMNLSAFFFADRWALSWFSLSPEASAMALEVMMWFNIVSLFFWPSSFTLPNILRAAGDASFTMTVSIVSMWVFRVGFCYLWVLKMRGGLLSIWMGMYLDWAFRSICFTVRFVRGKWLEQKVI